MPGRYTGGGGIVPIPLDPATTAWVNAVVANGGSVTAGRQQVVNNLIKSLKGNGVWAKLDRLFIFAAENTASALTDMVADALATTNGSPSFTANRGYTGVDASTTVFIDTGFNPNTAGGNYTLNSSHLSMWSNTQANSASGGVAIGSFIGGALTSIRPRILDLELTTINTGGGTNVANTDSLGHRIANRTGASTELSYHNGSLFASPNTTSTSIPNDTIYALARHNDTAADNGDDHQNCGISIGGGLTGTDATNFYNALRTYMTAVGVP
jgi:hypothetical protein